VPLLDGGTQRLPRIIGMGRALELILTGKFIDAAEAYRMGLANEVVPTGESLARCVALAEALAALPQTAMRTDKQAAVMGFGRPLAEGLRIECEVGQTALAGHDIREGVAAFLEKRPAAFSDREC
jgi:enoyl-CoA hydratase